MKRLTSIFGWVLLLAVLAVPSFLFYNWWAKSKQASSAEQTQEQTSANIFAAAEKKQTAAPVAPSTAAPAQAVPAAQAETPAAPEAASQRPAAQAPVQLQPVPQAPLVSTAAVQPAQAAQVSTGAPLAVQVSTQAKLVSYYTPKGDRDPTLSPADYSRIKEAELQRLEDERQRRLAASRRPKEAQFESRLQLQGIVGNAAIINGEMYSAGQMIYGAKILKVGVNYVIGEYKGRKFRKVLQ
jgi:hypothetical protein